MLHFQVVTSKLVQLPDFRRDCLQNIIFLHLRAAVVLDPGHFSRRRSDHQPQELIRVQSRSTRPDAPLIQDGRLEAMRRRRQGAPLSPPVGAASLADDFSAPLHKRVGSAAVVKGFFFHPLVLTPCSARVFPAQSAVAVKTIVKCRGCPMPRIPQR